MHQLREQPYASADHRQKLTDVRVLSYRYSSTHSTTHRLTQRLKTSTTVLDMLKYVVEYTLKHNLTPKLQQRCTTCTITDNRHSSTRTCTVLPRACPRSSVSSVQEQWVAPTILVSFSSFRVLYCTLRLRTTSQPLQGFQFRKFENSKIRKFENSKIRKFELEIAIIVT